MVFDGDRPFSLLKRIEYDLHIEGDRPLSLLKLAMNWIEYDLNIQDLNIEGDIPLSLLKLATNWI